MKLYTPHLTKFDPKLIHVSIYGLGKMGLPLAVAFASKGFQVIGVDLNEDLIKKIALGKNPIKGERGLDNLLKKVVKSKNLQATSDGTKASESTDVKIIIVPTYLDTKNNPDLSIVISVARVIAKGLQKGDIVILESTAPPGTTLEVIGKTLEKESCLILNRDFGVAHCPERTNSGTALEDIFGRLNPKVISGSDKITLKAMKLVYSSINSKGIVPVSSPTAAEMVKVSEGLYRDLNIAFANNLYLICNEIDIDVMEIIQAANTDEVCKILAPGPGVGGHCIPVYPYFILNKVSNHTELIKLGRKINDNMATHTIFLIKQALKQKEILIKNANILVMGIAYRGGVKEIRKSPGLKIAQKLQKLAGKVYVYDPLFNEPEIQKLGFHFKNDYKDIDCVVITAEHEEFKKLNWDQLNKQLRTKCIVDTKRILNRSTITEDYVLKTIGYA